MTADLPCTCGQSHLDTCDGKCLVSTNSRAAIVERREEIQALPRPSKLSDVDLREEVRVARETQDVFRVYVKEWVVRYVSEHPDQLGVQECQAHFDAKYGGRILDKDVRVEATIGGLSALHLRVPNLRGEFKHRDDAEHYIDGILREIFPEGDPLIVVRSSREEHDLKRYGVMKLSAEQLAKEKE